MQTPLYSVTSKINKAVSRCLVWGLLLSGLLMPFQLFAFPTPCDSCNFKVNSLETPFKLSGTWLFTRDDQPENKNSELAIENWKTVKTPGPWKKVYNDGKNFTVGWYRGYFEFAPGLIGKEVVMLVDTYMGRMTVWLDENEIFHRGESNATQRYYSIQPVPLRFKVTQTHHVVALRVETILMTGVYQLPFQLREYRQNDPFLALAALWGGEVRLIAAHVIFFFGLFFLLVYAKTRYLLYLVAACASLLIYTFFAFPGEAFLKFFSPETLLIMHYTGIGLMALSHYYFAQFFFRATPRMNIVHAVVIGVLCLLFISQTMLFNLKLFQIIRSIMLLYSLALAFGFAYMYIIAVIRKKKYATILMFGELFFVFTCVHDVLIALGLIDSIAMIFTGCLVATISMLWVASNLFADTFVENKEMNAHLEEMNLHLEDLVDERTKQLRQKTNDIVNIMENLPEGVLTVTPQRTIHHEYSAYLETILESNEIADKDVMDVVFKGSNLDSNQWSTVETLFSSCIGEDRMNFEFNQHLMVTEIEKEFNGTRKVLELSWAPMCDEVGSIEKIMITIRDVTTLRELQKEASSQKRELEIIGQILGVTQEKFFEFIQSSRQFIDENKSLIEKTASKDTEVIQKLFRNMHTIKGNARTYGLIQLTNTVHETENEYDQLRKDPEKEWNPVSMLAQLQDTQNIIEEYARVNEQKLGRKGAGRRGNVDRFLMVKREQIAKAVELLEQADPANQDQLKNALHRIHMTLKVFGTDKIQNVLSGVIESIPSLAKELNKHVPEIIINDKNIFLHNQVFGVLRNTFMHIFRNSLDHGIETPEDRIGKGKSPEGHIRINVNMEDNRLVIRYKDDGRGLALHKIRQKALERELIRQDNLPQPQEIANLIFHSGFSTAEKVTEVSGRGVGMDAVKNFVEEIGGKLEIQLTDIKADSDFVAFQMMISLPEKFGVKVKESSIIQPDVI
ncbi:MAG: Hpt domain-containing protein [SAR324 cluster bacterium]|nr:Hpt domain-containing protein [SAR324 cluster bacterium]